MGINFEADKKVILSTNNSRNQSEVKTSGNDKKPTSAEIREEMAKLAKSNADNGTAAQTTGSAETMTTDLPSGFNIEKAQLTPEQKAAKAKEKKEAIAKLDKKVSSTDISYADAKAKIKEIEEKYKDDKYFTTRTKEFFEGVRGEWGGYTIAISHIPVKEFDSSKLPEPARTEYREAMAAKEEIEQNNTDLCNKAGIPVTEYKLGYTAGRISDAQLETLIEASDIGKTVELSEKQKAARAKLDEKTSSSGAKYKDSQAKLAELKKKYENNPACQSEFESIQPKNLEIYRLPYKAFDPYKMPEPDRTAYFEALESVNEIEKKNSALMEQGGVGKTPQPSRNYHNEQAHEVLE